MHSRLYLRLTVSLALSLILGCATPGPPKPPTLNLPEPTRDLTATRIGDTVELRFTIPSRSTDKLALRGANLTARFCRSVDTSPCQVLPGTLVPLGADGSRHTSFTWSDTLPADLARGTPRLLRYTVELLNVAGRSAGRSEPAFTAAGAAPAAVVGLNAKGSRLGIVLGWDEAAGQSGEIVLQRENVAKATAVQLTGNASNRLLDTSAKVDVPYRYTATRTVTVQLGGRGIELRSAASPGVEIALTAVYPPPAPTGLTVAASTEGGFAIDLIWEPVDDAGLIVPFAGYNVYRGTGEATTRLNVSPVTVPAFHDATAVAGVKYRYRVTAVDAKGNESLGNFVYVGP